jgi:lantibiotic leader peptide-processing serine protease
MPEVERTVTNDCLDLPTEGPHVISVSAVGPSTTEADYSNYGLGIPEVSAPGGWFRDFVGTPQFRHQPTWCWRPTRCTSPRPTTHRSRMRTATPSTTSRWCRAIAGATTAASTYLQGTSMASPHVAGLAALVIEEHGHRGRGGYSLDPDTVGSIVENTAADRACPAGGVEIYTDEGRPAEFNAICQGTTDDNGHYGEGIVNAAAVARR